MKRRTFLKGSALGSMVAFFASSNLNANLLKDKDLLNFKEVPASIEDKVIVPDGYKAEILISWGDPLFKKASHYDEKKNIDKKAIENAKLVFGDNNDGMSFFPLMENKAILAINNEYINPEIMFNHQGKDLTLDDVLYEQASLGVSILEIQKEKDQWSVVLDSKYNRRIDANTKMSVSGPAKQQVLQNEKFVYGTLNNCANGKTPWGTYLTCEENINDFFGSLDEKIAFSKEQLRFGFKTQSQYGWEKFDERFDLSKNPQEANKFGWVVEIDPFDPNSIPVKRTALGRFKHENAELIVENDGTVVVYMGDDEADEFIYKFVSKHKYQKGSDTSKILDEGTLYVAQFNGKIGDFRGNGKWIELEYGKNNLDEKNGFNSQANVLINARIAGSIVGATPMDRCEWIASHKESGSVEAFATLTNNKNNNNPNPANPRTKNVYGQIIKWKHKSSHKDNEFTWEIFALAGNPDNQTSLNKGSNNITSKNKFNSPDGLSFDRDGRLWIQTDGNYSNKEEFEGMGNNCMLAANPKTGEIKRFLTGPIACEITGIAFSQDYKTMFIGIQHPGEKLKGSTFPYGKTPRSSIVAISKIDGGVIGS
ncbi:PhoX family phosphatase [Campylobacter volucris]|uniref:PhoX family protein n=1 Tax=Campylobacter volucris TaxID=1031542 RepID=UPI00189EA1AE|nr:PhoX family phosphatase [Campylobacter volucris]MBF7048245.1 PhoX family phosphatase [Campylobacter volucris]MBF7060094.1 PhoX family phosphatase [Campylobacter volucris]